MLSKYPKQEVYLLSEKGSATKGSNICEESQTKHIFQWFCQLMLRSPKQF